MASVISRVDEILSVLRTEILSGQYRVRERLPSERDLAARFGVNRGAVREVIKKLEQLGIIEVTPGGVRVLPVEEATLDVLGYLLELDEIAKPELIGQMLDVLGAMTALSIRTAMTRATVAELAEIADAIACLVVSMDAGDGEQHHLNWRAVNEKLIDIHQNLVLRLVGNGIRTQFIGHIQRASFEHEVALSGIRNALVEFEASVRGGDIEAAEQAVIQHFQHMKNAVSNLAVNQAEPARRAEHG